MITTGGREGGGKAVEPVNPRERYTYQSEPFDLLNFIFSPPSLPPSSSSPLPHLHHLHHLHHFLISTIFTISTISTIFTTSSSPPSPPSTPLFHLFHPHHFHQVLHNSSGHLGGPARSIGAVLIGYLGAPLSVHFKSMLFLIILLALYFSLQFIIILLHHLHSNPFNFL